MRENGRAGGIPGAVGGRKFRRRLMLFWILLTLTALGAVVLVLSAAGIFSNADRRVQQGLEAQLQTTGSNLQSYLDQLAARSLILSAEADREIDNLLMMSGLSFPDLNDDPEALLELQKALYAPLHTTLLISNCSGAYVVLDVTGNTAIPAAAASRSGLYLRAVNLTGTHQADPDLCLFRGIPEVARQKGAELHNRWDLEFDTDRIPGYADLVGRKLSRPADHYYWTERVALKDTWEEALLLCVPVVGDNKTVYGVCGVEVSARFLQLCLPVRETEFGPLMTVLAPLENGKLMVRKGLHGGVSGGELDAVEELTVHQGRAFSTYLCGEREFVGVQQPVRISTEDEEQRQWAAALLLPGESYSAYVSHSRRKTVFACLAALLALSAVSALLYWRFVRSMSGTSARHAGPGAPADDLGELLDFVRSRSPGDLTDRSALPQAIERNLARFLERVSGLAIEERRIFCLLAEGCDPAGLTARTGLSDRAVRMRLRRLQDRLGVASVDDILLYIDFFRRCGRQEQLRRI